MHARSCLVLLSATLILATGQPSLQAAARESAPKLLSTSATPRWKDEADMKRMAEAGDAEACLEMGLLAENGGETPPDYIAARLWYERAARAGLIEAEFRLGKLVSEGLGGSENQEAAFAHYLKAAEGGMPIAQYNVGAMLSSGRGVRRDYIEGLAWLIVASRDPEVDPEGEKRLRTHLARRPADIAAAEERAGAITTMLAESRAKAEAVKPAPARK